MVASFPSAVKSFVQQVDGVDWVLAQDINDAYDEIEAIETELGTDPAGSMSDLKTRLAVSLDDDGTLKLTAITEHTGIADNNIVEVDGSPNSGELAIWTANGLQGKVIGIANDNILEVDDSPNDNEICRFTPNGIEGRTNAEMKTQLGYMTDLSDDSTPTLSGAMDASDEKIYDAQTITFEDEHDNGNSSTADTINWNNGQKQKSTMTGDCTYTFTAPTNGIGNFILKLVQDATGSRNPTWPATVKWEGGTEPTWSTDPNAVDIIAFYYDGTNYYGSAGTGYA